MERLLARAQIPDALVWQYLPGEKFSMFEGFRRILHTYQNHPEFLRVPRILELYAGVGVGKTTIIPYIICTNTNQAVIVVVPKVAIAREIQSFMNKQLSLQNLQIRINMITGKEAIRVTQGISITIVTYGVLSRWLTDKNSTSLNNHIIIFDESLVLWRYKQFAIIL